MLKLLVSKQEWQFACKKSFTNVFFITLGEMAFTSVVNFRKLLKKNLPWFEKSSFYFRSASLVLIKAFKISYQNFCNSLSTAEIS